MSSKPLTRKELENLIKQVDDSVVYVEKKKLPSSSDLWDHFHQVFVGAVKQQSVSCNIRKSLLAYTSTNGTKNMKTHLHSCSKSFVKGTDGNQKSIKEFCSPPASTVIPKRIKASIATACAEFAALDGRASNTMSGIGFLDLAKQLLHAGRVMGC